MKKPQQTDNFFEMHLNLVQCPFLTLWILEEQNNILEAEIRVRRKGLPKTGPHPMVRHKKFLALAKAFMDFKLKGFAQAFDLSYGVVRLWNREPRVAEKSREYMAAFARSYIKKLEKLSFSKKLNLKNYNAKTFQKAQEKIKFLISEALHYNPKVQLSISFLMEVKIESATEDESYIWRIIFYSYASNLSNRDILNPPQNEKEREAFLLTIENKTKLSQMLAKSLFSSLKQQIKDGDTQEAQHLADFLGDHFFELNKSYGDLQSQIVKDKSKKGQRNREN